jgi:hypothetical protein
VTIQEFDHLLVNGERIEPGKTALVKMSGGQIAEGKVLKIYGTVGGIQIRILSGSLVLNVGVAQIVDNTGKAGGR